MNREQAILFDIKIIAANMGVSIKYKDNSWFMKVLIKILFFNKKFMTRFTTTIGKTVYFPSSQWEDRDPLRSAEVLCHELVHVEDQMRLGTLRYVVAYLAPQLLALLTLLSVWFGPAHLAWLLCLLPIPSPGRAWLEARAYAVSIITKSWLYDEELKPKQWMIDSFTGPNYYWMWPFHSHVHRQLEAL